MIGLMNGLGERSAEDWPMHGRLRKRPVRCYCGGVWQTLDPERYNIIDLGIGEQELERNQALGIHRRRKERSEYDEDVEPTPAPDKPSPTTLIIDFLRNAPEPQTMKEIAAGIGLGVGVVSQRVYKAGNIAQVKMGKGYAYELRESK